MKMVTRVVSAGLAAAAVLGAGVALPAAPAAAQSVTRWVDNDSSARGPRPCADAAYDTIQAAVDVANPGDVILVCPGTYAENIVILTDDLTVASTGGQSVTTVAAPASPSSPYLASLGYNHVFYIRAPEATVKGFTVVPAGVADPDIGVNVAVEGWTGLEVVESRVIGGRIGINLGCTSYGSRIGHNDFYRQTQSAINVDTCEVDPDPGSPLNPGSRLNDIHHNFFCAPTVSGSIALGGSSDLNHIHHNTVMSISLFGWANAVYDNTTQLPIVDNGTQSVLFGNTVDPALCG